MDVEDAPPRYDDAVGDKDESTSSNHVERPPKRNAQVFPIHQLHVHATESGNDATKNLEKISAESLEERLDAAAAAPSPSDAATTLVPNSFPPPSPPCHPSVAAITVSSIATGDIHPPAENSRPVTTPKHNLGNDLTELIFHTSKLLSQFHDDYLAQLLHLGFHARECNVSSFDATRNALMVAVIQHCATATTTFSWTDNLEAHFGYLRRWMNLKVYRNADPHVLENLVRLQAAALRMKEARDGPSKELARLAFDEEKADCLASLFCIFGSKV